MKFLNSFFFCISALSFCITTVSSVGLNEEFTWTRVNYEWPQTGTVEMTPRFSFGSSSWSRSHSHSHSHSHKHHGNNGDNPITFEGLQSSQNSQTDGNTNDQNQNNNNNNHTDDNGVSAVMPGSMDYQYVNNIPMGLNVWKDKLFISIPRRRLGVPATLNYIPLNSKGRHNVPLKPYPNWDINLYPDTSGHGDNLISVYRFAIDPCDRMWLVDTGILELPGNRTYVRPQHQLVVIDLETEKIITRYNLPDNVVTPATTLSSVTVDVSKGTCGDAYVYFPDLAGYGLIVYSARENRAWRINHNYFYLESMNGDFFIAGHRFLWNDGIFSIELSNVKKDGYKDAYFHSMAGTHQYKVSTRVLTNETLATRSYHDNDFQIIGYRGPQTQTSTAGLHAPTGTMFLGLVNKNAMACWNINKRLNTISIVHRNDDKMIYPSDVKIVGDKVYMLTTTMPGFLYGQLNYDEINFRVWSSDVHSATKGTSC